VKVIEFYSIINIDDTNGHIDAEKVNEVLEKAESWVESSALLMGNDWVVSVLGFDMKLKIYGVAVTVKFVPKHGA